jgi:hypothetical protein
MPDTFTVKCWRDRAQDARTLAERMNEADVRETLLRIADDYERSAGRADEIRRSKTAADHERVRDEGRSAD